MTDIKFTKTHEWARLEKDGTVTIGITDHAQHALGDMVFVEQPEKGEPINAGKECAVIESVKSASDIISPLSGEVIATNDEIVENPEILNKDPQNSGWLFKIRPSNIKELDELMDTEAYEKYLADTSH
ncbi:MAG: glycine cleavage system protein GcvH [Gammaproteobacteria bacterium]|nr:glycine cleavage system protein GcvH [Gammaproteobacteria bacterium]